MSPRKKKTPQAAATAPEVEVQVTEIMIPMAPKPAKKAKKAKVKQPEVAPSEIEQPQAVQSEVAPSVVEEPQTAQSEVESPAAEQPQAVQPKVKLPKANSSKCPEGFIPVTVKGKRDQYPIGSIPSCQLVSPTNSEVDKKYSKYAILSNGTGTDKTLYYVKPGNFEDVLLRENLTPANTIEIREGVQKSLANFKKAWLVFGTAVAVVNKSRIYRVWGFATFDDYCVQELKLHQSTVHEIINSTLFLSQENPDLYHTFISKTSTTTEQLPSYHSLYLLASKRTKLGKERFADLLQKVINGEISSRDLQENVKNIEGSSKRSETPSYVIKNYERWYERLSKVNLTPEIGAKAAELLNLLKKIEPAK